MKSNKKFIRAFLLGVYCFTSLFAVASHSTTIGIEDTNNNTLQDQQNSVDLTILADEYLRLPLSLISRAYSAQGKGVVTLWFVKAVAMVDTIGEDADADLVITSDHATITHLENSGQINVYATDTIVMTPLVIAVAKNVSLASTSNTLSLLDWRYNRQEPQRIIVLNNGDAILKRMTEKALLRSDLLNSGTIKPFIVTSIKDAITRMKSKKHPALLLASDAFSEPDIRVIQRFPNSIVAPAQFKAAILAGEHMSNAKDFLQFLKTPTAQYYFKLYGLSPTHLSVSK